MTSNPSDQGRQNPPLPHCVHLFGYQYPINIPPFPLLPLTPAEKLVIPRGFKAESGEFYPRVLPAKVDRNLSGLAGNLILYISVASN